jgi:hypothetical protein
LASSVDCRFSYPVKVAHVVKGRSPQLVAQTPEITIARVCLIKHRVLAFLKKEFPRFERLAERDVVR